MNSFIQIKWRFLFSLVAAVTLNAHLVYSQDMSKRVGLPERGFVENRGQMAKKTTRFYLQLTSLLEVAIQDDGAIDLIQLEKIAPDQSNSGDQGKRLEVKKRNASLVRLKRDGAKAVSVEGREELSGRVNFFRGSNQKKWATDLKQFNSIQVVYDDGVTLTVQQQGIQENGLQSRDGRKIQYQLSTFPGSTPLNQVQFKVEGATIEEAEEGALGIQASTGAFQFSTPQWSGGASGATPAGGQFVASSGGFGFGSSAASIGMLTFSTIFGGGNIDEIHRMKTDKNNLSTVIGITFETIANETSFPTLPGDFQINHQPMSPESGLSNWPVTHPLSGRSVDGFIYQVNTDSGRILYSTIVGGRGNDYLEAVHVLPGGLITVGGYIEHNPFTSTTPGADVSFGQDGFPITPGTAAQTSFQNPLGDQFNLWAFREAMVAQFDPNQLGSKQLRYGSYFGGMYHDDIRAIYANGPGSMIIAGLTSSPDLPGILPNSIDPLLGLDGVAMVTPPPAVTTAEYDGFVARIDSARQAGWDSAVALAVGPGDPSNAGYKEVEGKTEVRWATYWGGGSQPDGLATFDMITNMDVRGNVITLVGRTDSLNMPTTPNAFQTALSGNAGWWDAFVVQLTEKQRDRVVLRYSTYLGGDDFDIAEGVRVHPRTGRIYVMGNTTSGSKSTFNLLCQCYPNANPFPTTAGAYDRILNFTGDTMVLTDCIGSPYLDSFVSILDPTEVGEAQLIASTFFGGASHEIGVEISINAFDQVGIAGWTLSSGNNALPVTQNHYQPDLNPGGPVLVSGCNYATGEYGSLAADAFLVRLDEKLENLLYSSYFGAKQDEIVRGLNLNDQGGMTISGYTYSNRDGNGHHPTSAFGSVDFPTTDGSSYVDSTIAKGYPINRFFLNDDFNLGDGFISRIQTAVDGTFRYGKSSFCSVPLTVEVLDRPSAGAINQLRVAVSGAPVNRPGELWVSNVGRTEVVDSVHGGITRLVDAYAAIPVLSDENGLAKTLVDISSLTPGNQLWFQYVFLEENGTECTNYSTGHQSFVASDGLEVKILN